MPVRLGHDVFLSGALTPEAMEAGVAALQGFRDLLDAQGVTHLRAVATSAVREAGNGEDFASMVASRTGIPLEVIGGAEEARLVHAALRWRVPMGHQRWVAADLGGGSVEVSLVDADGILWSESHAMGSVRLLEELSGVGDEPGRFQNLLTEYLGALHLPLVTERYRPVGFLATGGNIEALAKLAGGPADRRGCIRLPLASLRTLIQALARMSFRQRIEAYGLREDRADVILPAAMVYERLATLAGVDEVRVPNVGLREGLVLDLVERLANPDARDSRREQQVVSACLTLGRKYLLDEPHARQVTDLALSLFDQLQDLHQLERGDRVVLTAAALLHDVGTFVSTKRHHRHSHYLIQHSELPGLDGDDQVLAALVARFHRKSEPSPRHPEMACLAQEDQVRVQRLAGLLRLADALDREHRQVVRSVRARVRKDALELQVEGSGDLCLERWAVARKGGYLATLFNLALRVDGVA